ncbi:hypothetical protein DPMN_184209 [Dreissena polymorpha]|uniref:Uncharacterized protein n=1 Tax=Dreissena polymorpha TaxID=45954 RepID=A0A9D4DIT7_DREPO|nr:hypothetical protein DPMN_184209 [Dreissena polymorpha]
MNLLTNKCGLKKNAPPLGSHVFQANVTIVELIHDINKTNLLTIFHEDWTINVASRVLTRKNAPHPGSHVFRPKGIISKPVQDIIGMNLQNKFHEHRTINVASRVKNAPPLGSHVFQAQVAISVLIQDIIGTNLLSKFHEDRKYIIGIHLLTKFHEDQINVASKSEKCPAPWQPCFYANVTIFKLIQDIIETNVLTKFHAVFIQFQYK